MFLGSNQMNSDNIKNLVSGAFIVDKPVGITSHDVVQIIRRGTGIRRVGHTGTLDPRASGVLVILVGPSVRLSEFISASNKRYQATIHLGSSTETYDAESTPTEEVEVSVTEEQFSEILNGYVGEIEQVPPPYSAVKVKGKKAYEMARKGEVVELEPRIINVYNLEVLEWALPEVVIDAHCSSGTYIRSLANDLGEELGTGAHLVGLRRTMSGRFTMRDAVSLRRLKEAFEIGTWAEFLIPAAEALGDWHTITVDPEQLNLVRNGHRIPAEDDAPEMARAISEQGDLVAILALVEETQEWQPRKVFMS
jgi:tRNA pseudouridine55 synthase